MDVQGIFTRIFSSTGDLSSGRIGHFIGLIAIITYTGWDTWMNKALNPILAGMILGSGTAGYAVTKSGDKNVSITTKADPAIS